jgi:hypothetical protein
MEGGWGSVERREQFAPPRLGILKGAMKGAWDWLGGGRSASRKSTSQVPFLLRDP